MGLNYTPFLGLAVTSQVAYTQHYFGASANGVTSPVAGNRNLSMVRTATGRWTVTFDTPHPNGLGYHVSITAEEQSNFRDIPDITIVQGSKTVNGFALQITTGDNGTTADPHVDTPFTISVDAPISVITEGT